VIPQVATPTADLGASYTLDPIAGAVVVDLTPSADGDLGVVTGISRLAQDVTKFLYTPPGADPFNPSYGNALWADIGQPLAANLADYGATLDASLADFAARQQADAAAGLLATDEQLDTWDPPSLSLSGATLTIGLRIYARSGEGTQAGATLSTS